MTNADSRSLRSTKKLMPEIALAIFATAALAVALAALYALGRLSIAQGRFDTDAQQRAVNLQRYIDQQVDRRILYGTVQVKGPVTQTGAAPQPNFQARGRLDDVAEAERDERRFRGEDDMPPARDSFEAQPMVEM